MVEIPNQRIRDLLDKKIPQDLVFDPNKEFSTFRGFRSRIDGSVQPVGIAYIPASQPHSAPNLLRCDVWCRGRSEKGLELQFLAQRIDRADRAPAPGVLMVYPFGRYCNANKLAGEVDTFEALDRAIREYPIDPKGVAIRGFSMGGAAAWHLAVHHPDKWFAANPGAGFSETPLFLESFQNEKLTPTEYEKDLWKLYDCPFWVNNLKNVPTIAYSGEIDKQKQAADVMAAASWNQDTVDQFELTHLIGPQTAHRIEESVGEEIERRLAILFNLRSNQPPKKIDFTTYTLKYNRCHYLTIDALKEHWRPARVRSSLVDNRFYIRANGVSKMTFSIDADSIPLSIESISFHFHSPEVENKSEQTIYVKRSSDKSFLASFEYDESDKESPWNVISPLSSTSTDGLVKKHDLQGPIDDAFMNSFIFVKPNVASSNQLLDKWVDSEMERATREWHRQMRGTVRVLTSDQVTEKDLQENNVVVWGSPQSNPMISQILSKLPLEWTDNTLSLGNHSLDAKYHVPVMIYPNPLNPRRYVVLNSGLTYREYDYLNNARQVPKLPDWALLDIREPAGPRWPGKIEKAGFFDEKWKFKQSISPTNDLAE